MKILLLSLLLLLLCYYIIKSDLVSDVEIINRINPNNPKPLTPQELENKRNHYYKSRTYDIVIAHCKKDMEWITPYIDLCREYKLRIFIYTKCGRIESLHHLQLKDTTNCLGIMPMSNYGREAYTYLSHIINHYDRLPTMTFFMQDDTKEKENFNIYSDFVKVLKSRNGFYSLTHTVQGMGTIPNADEFKNLINKWLDPYFLSSVFNEKVMWITNWRAIFGVSSVRINHMPLEFYKDALKISNCSEEESPFLLCPNDFFEIIWGALFHCYLGPDGLVSGSSASLSDFPQNKTTTRIFKCPNRDVNILTPLELNTYTLSGSTFHQSIHYPQRKSFELGQYGEDCDGLFIQCYDFY